MRANTIRITVEIVAALTFLILPLILVPVVTPLVSYSPLQPVLWGIILTHSLLIAFYYWNFYFAIPKLYFKKQHRRYAIITLAILAGIIAVLVSNSRYNPFPAPPFRYPNFVFSLSIVIRFMMIMFISFAVATYSRLRKAEEEGLRSELAYLKAQVNPHFLFNTLNSIYALSVKKSDAAPESVTRLSSIMRYVITDAANDLVSLEKEIDYLKSYIQLEQLRLTDKTSLHYEFEGDAEGRMIAPLIFLPVIENAFKYGVSTSQSSTIHIRLEVDGSRITLECSNTKPDTQRPQGAGLGIANVKKRLALLYPGRHDLVITESDKEFSVKLALRLND